MADGDGSASGERSPRRFLVDPSKFGRDPHARWLPLTSDMDVAEVIAAYWQHLAVCVLRQHYGERAAEELAALRDVTNVTYLRRKVLGEYPAPFEELLTWVIAVGDISMLPQLNQLEDLYPPGAN